MHEYALAQDIITTIGEKVTEDFDKIGRINIDVGTFSGVVAESLEFGIQAILTEKEVNDVTVNITRVPTRARCECGTEYELADVFRVCPSCQSLSREMISGMDIVINSVELLEE